MSVEDRVEEDGSGDVDDLGRVGRQHEPHAAPRGRHGDEPLAPAPGGHARDGKLLVLATDIAVERESPATHMRHPEDELEALVPGGERPAEVTQVGHGVRSDARLAEAREAALCGPVVAAGSLGRLELVAGIVAEERGLDDFAAGRYALALAYAPELPWHEAYPPDRRLLVVAAGALRT